ncbi:PT domain-containing protein [Streptomyces sp. SD31]|uniref:PT domain-containing protein n=1 Tax=Streptomyces sp. SD31 TaxID=3452208 RepID=UPI003F88F10B
MNTERPENDDTGADGSAEEQGVREENGAAGAVEDGTTVPDAEATGAEDERAHEETDHEEAARHEAGVSDSARRRSPAIIASVAAAVLLVGGGGAYLAASASGGSDGGTASGTSGDDTPPPLHLDGYTEGGTGGTGGIAPGEPNPYGVTYKADGELADGPGSAPVYRAQGEVGADEVARLAEALGVDGKPVAQGQTWKVGAKDGSGPSLQVNKQAPGTWTFYRYAPGTDNCESTTVCDKGAADRAADPVSEAAAKKAAAPVLKAVGQDDAKLDAGQLMGAQRVVNASPLVGGLPTYGWTTGVTVSAQGEVVGGSGQLKAPVKGDTYPVLDAEKTLGLMNAAPGTDHRMGIGGCASPVPLKDRLEAPCGSEASTGAPAKDTVTVEKAVFGLASHSVDTRQALVPSWLFEVRAPGAQDGFTVTYPAVDPKYLVSATPSEEPSGQPSGQPTPRPTEPKDEPTSAPVTRNVAVDGYTVDGRELTVAFTGGVCAEYKVTASESEDEVTVQVTETSQPDKICIMIAKVFHKTVQLDEPLGDRKVVGSDGQAVPLEKPGTRLPDAPETSGAR